MSNGKPDVIVVGGGVIGCATAYCLAAEHGVRSLIIERNAIASEASGGAAGELAAMELASPDGQEQRDGASPEFTRFLVEGIELHASIAPTLLEESGVDYLLADLPMLRPAFDEAEALTAQAGLEGQRALGLHGEWLDREELQAMGSWLADDAVGAVYSTERQVEAYPFTIALAQAAERHGVEIRTGNVTGLLHEGARVTGVRMGGETIEADAVVIASGPWAQHAGAWMGVDVPIIPMRGQIVHLGLPPGLPARGRARHAIFHESGYVLPKAGGDLMAGTTVEDVGFDKQTTREAQDGIMEAAVRLAPIVLDAPIREMTACLRPYSSDGLPIIGAVPAWERLFIATGHGFKGITLALVTGKSLAQLMATGASDVALDAFSAARLGPAER